MKPFVLSILLLSFSLTGLSQDSDFNKFSLESQFTVFNSNAVVTPNLKFRYLSESGNVFRTTLNASYTDLTTEILEVDGDGVGSVQTTNSSFVLGLGYEKHLSMDKVSPYIGGSILIGAGKNSTYGSRTDAAVFINDFNYNSKINTSYFGVHLFTGVDVTIYKGLFLGTEIGYKFISLRDKRGEYNTTDASSTTNSETTTAIPEKKSKSFSLVNMGVLRVGWKF
ncbi:MAG: hypothetical protein ACI8Q1_002774 [Parvicella sp.]|jgi:hypothetical protein